MYFLGDPNGPANGHCHKSQSPQGTEVTSWCTQIWGEEFMGQNPKTPGPTWPETGPTWPKSPGLDPPFRCPFPFRTSEGHLELSLVVFLGNIQRIGLAKLSTSCSHKKKSFKIRDVPSGFTRLISNADSTCWSPWALFHGKTSRGAIPMTHKTQQTSFINPELTPLFRPNIFKLIYPDAS